MDSHKYSQPWTIEKPSPGEYGVFTRNARDIPFPGEKGNPGNPREHKERNGIPRGPWECKIGFVQYGDYQKWASHYQKRSHYIEISKRAIWGSCSKWRSVLIKTEVFGHRSDDDNDRNNAQGCTNNLISIPFNTDAEHSHTWRKTSIARPSFPQEHRQRLGLSKMQRQGKMTWDCCRVEASF